MGLETKKKIWSQYIYQTNMAEIAIKCFFNSTLLLSNYYYSTTKFKIPKFHLIYWNHLRVSQSKINNR